MSNEIKNFEEVLAEELKVLRTSTNHEEGRRCADEGEQVEIIRACTFGWRNTERDI
jgi:hypothetical protein